MLISYDEFLEILSRRIQSGVDFYQSLLENVISNPSRYCGLFRLSNAKTKLMQNVTQSKEIKFGDLIEELTTKYLEKLGFNMFDKYLGKDEYDDKFYVDQYFSDDEKIYMVEMKIRDDHDSTKKRGQYVNFIKKVNLVIQRNPDKFIEAIMWFVDDGLKKNRNYYRSEMDAESFDNCNLNLFYGEDFFNSLENGPQAWDEFVGMLREYRLENAQTDVEIPDFGSSNEIYNALLRLSPRNWNKLISDDPQFVLLRSELFDSGDNIKRATIAREKK